MPIKKEVTIGDCRLILGDCLDVLPYLEGVDACVCDPPYGIGEAAGKNKSRSNAAVAKDYGNKEWDNKPAATEIIELIRKISKYQIIFGGNYFDLPPTSCWLVWDKQNGSNDFADCELAWTNLKKAVRRVYWRWNGMIRKGNDVRVHPTQKPVGVMEWCITQLPKEVVTICDPMMGSGSTLVACAKMGRKGIGIELDPDYFEIACERVRKAYEQPDFLIEQPKAKPEQVKLI